jgi:uncharacterized protein (DUF433 family)
MPKRDIFINFQDLVSLRMIISLRIAGFTLKQIRIAQKYLREMTGHERPFALKDLWLSDTDIFIEMEGMLSATKQGQYAMDFVKDWLHRLRRPDVGSLDLTFEREENMEVASSWIPQPQIQLNPLIQFGAPCILGTRVPTETIWSMFIAGDTAESLAASYHLTLDKIQSALEWEKKIAAANS